MTEPVFDRDRSDVYRLARKRDGLVDARTGDDIESERGRLRARAPLR